MTTMTTTRNFYRVATLSNGQVLTSTDHDTYEDAAAEFGRRTHNASATGWDLTDYTQRGEEADAAYEMGGLRVTCHLMALQVWTPTN